MELALRIAEVLQATRGTSTFAVDTFLRAVESDDVIGARLEMRYRKKEGRVEASVHVGPEVVE